MPDSIDRRNFLRSSAAGLAASAALSLAGEQRAEAEDQPAKAGGANDKIVLALMGCNSRGSQLAQGFAGVPNIEFAYVCDVDERAIGKGIQTITSGGGKAPQGVKDFRKALDDPAVDGLVCAAPNHWHAPATILACAAGKHVYVEKPCCHNPREGELMIEAARKHNRVVQQGSQRRSSEMVMGAHEQLKSGAIGKVHFARSWYCNRRPTIGVGKPADVPSWLDYELWQGPAPAKPFKDNLVHYNWHWHWHWGNGELGNNGIHTIDICRWLMGVEFPSRVTSGGGRHRYDDDQETPDSHVVTYDFPEATIVWEGLSWANRGFEMVPYGAAFQGDDGTLVLLDSGWTVFDLQNKEVRKGTGSRGDKEHLQNFVDCCRSGERPNADIAEAYKSTLLCHLGNIAHRTGHTLHTNPENGHIKDDPAAEALWSREYQPGWEPKV